MLIVETNCNFDKIEKSLSELMPDIKLTHIITDDNLKQFGFTENPPCVFIMDMTTEEFDNMMSDLMQIEIDAFNTPDGAPPNKNDPYYQKYLRYGWLWDMFYNAKVVEK